MSDTPLTDQVTSDCAPMVRKAQFFKMRGHVMNLERQLSQALIQPSRPDKADEIIADLLAVHPDSITNATDEDLVEAFLDMEAEQVIRDTAQAVLEARKYLRSPRP